MSEPRRTYVHEAELQVAEATDPAAVGAAVTAALCGHWEHPGPCRWPHNNEVEVSGARANFRTLFVAPAREEAEVRARIERALRDGSGWAVLRASSRPVSPFEHELALGLLATRSR